jgi:hypothetical protein
MSLQNLTDTSARLDLNIIWAGDVGIYFLAYLAARVRQDVT